MKKSVKISLNDILVIDVQLHGFVHPQTGKKLAKGLMDEKIGIKGRYWLGKLSESVLKEVRNIYKQRDELIKKYGDQDKKDGTWEVKMKIVPKGKKEEVDNPKFKAFEKEYMDFLNQKIDFEYTIIPLELLESVETENNYSLLYQFFEVAEKAEQE